MAVVAWFLEKDEGAITMGLHLLPAWYTMVDSHLAEHEGVADKMDELHKRKIDISDEVFVIDHEEYIGDSTRSEIEYAENLGVPIRYFSREPAIGLKVWKAAGKTV